MGEKAPNIRPVTLEEVRDVLAQFVAPIGFYITLGDLVERKP